MLGNGHKLDGIIACFYDFGQDEPAKLVVGAYAFLFLRHSNMGFIDEQRLTGFEYRSFMPELVGFRRTPKLPAEVFGKLVLYNPLNVNRDAFVLADLTLDDNLDQAFVHKASGISLVVEKQLPYSSAIVDERMAVFVPVVEVAHQKQRSGIGCPLAVPPAFAHFVVVETEGFVRS